MLQPSASTASRDVSARCVCLRHIGNLNKRGIKHRRSQVGQGFASTAVRGLSSRCVSVWGAIGFDKRWKVVN